MSKAGMTLLLLAVLAGLAPCRPRTDKALRKATYQVTGMFRPDRVADFREAMKAVPDVKLVSVDYKNAEATFEFVAARAFPGAGKPEQIVEQLDSKVRQASQHTFGIRARRTMPREKLKLVEVRWPAAAARRVPWRRTRRSTVCRGSSRRRPASTRAA